MARSSVLSRPRKHSSGGWISTFVDPYQLPEQEFLEVSRRLADQLAAGVWDRTGTAKAFLRHPSCPKELVRAAVALAVSQSAPAYLLDVLLGSQALTPDLLPEILGVLEDACGHPKRLTAAYCGVLQHPRIPQDVLVQWCSPDRAYLCAVRLVRLRPEECGCYYPARFSDFLDSCRVPGVVVHPDYRWVLSCIASLLSAVACNLSTPDQCLVQLYRDAQRLPRSGRRAVCAALLSNPACPPALVGALSAQRGGYVRLAALEHPNLPRERVRRLVRGMLGGRCFGGWAGVSVVRALTSNPSVAPEDLQPLLLSESSDVRELVAECLSGRPVAGE